MTFEEYMDSKIPTWKYDISIELIRELKEFYQNVQYYNSLAKKIIDLSFNFNKSGIDYSTDFEKAQQNMYYYINLLQDNIEGIKKVISSNISNNL